MLAGIGDTPACTIPAIAMTVARERLRTTPGTAGALALGALALGLLIVHGAFYAQDTGPPVWDEALHLLVAARVHDVLSAPSRETGEALREASSFYPPLYHAGVGALFCLVGLSPLGARLVNLALLAVLGWGTFRAGAALLGVRAGALAAALVVTFPVVTRLARMAMTDLGLAAWTAAAVGCLLSTELRSGRDATRLGLLLGAGLLTKWTFPAFVIGPLAVWAITHGRSAPAGGRERARLAWATVLAVAVAVPWYAANARVIFERGRFLAGLGQTQGNPHGWTWANLLAYPRTILATFVSAPARWLLLGSALAGLICLASRRSPRAPQAEERAPRVGASVAVALVSSWLIVPYVAMTAISNKDPRFVLPLVAPLAVLCAWGLLAIPGRAPRVSVACALFAYLVALHVLAVLPEPRRQRPLSWLAWAPILEETMRSDLQNLARPPDPGWPATEIVDTIRSRLTPVAPYASLEVVPDLETVNPNSLAWLARRGGYRLDAHHPWHVAEFDLQSWEYVLIKPEGSQGASHTTLASDALTRRILGGPEAFRVVEEFVGPEAQSLVLLRTLASLPPDHLRASVIDLASPASRWHLGDGWGRLEPAGRWGLGRRAVVRIQLEAGRAYRMEVDLAPFSRLARPQLVTVRYGDTVVAGWRLADAGGGVFSAEVPSPLPTGGIDEVSLAFAEHARPADLGLSGDERPLAAFVRRIRFHPR